MTSQPEEVSITGLLAATDQYGAGLRDLAELNPKVLRTARTMATVIRQQYPEADGRAVIAAAMTAYGTVALVRHLGEGELDVQGIINLIFLAGMAMNGADAPEMPDA
jgi:hypothetical protein